MCTEASLGSETAQDVVVCAKEDNSVRWDPRLKILYTQVSTYWRSFSIRFFTDQPRKRLQDLDRKFTQGEKKSHEKNTRMTKVTHRPKSFSSVHQRPLLSLAGSKIN